MRKSRVPAPSEHVGEARAAEVLRSLGLIMEQLHQNDLALQDTLPELTGARLPHSKDLSRLQSLDLNTQIHADLARFLPVFADSLAGVGSGAQDAFETLTLRSLRRALAGCRTPNRGESATGDVWLF